MNRQWCFYAAETGRLSAGTLSLPAGVNPNDNAPAGHLAIEGRFDWLSQRVDLATGQVVDFVPPAPADTPDATHAWDDATRRWLAAPTLAATQHRASTVIDDSAGRARLRFITATPGQQSVYERKAAEAAAFAEAGFRGPVPAYVQAEADAIGATAQAAAERILARAGAWHEAAGPAIEKLRIGGKRAVAAAIDIQGVETACLQATEQLEALSAPSPPTPAARASEPTEPPHGAG